MLLTRAALPGMLIERAVEGMAAGEPEALGLRAETMRLLLVEAVADALG